jgi:pyridoxine 4-dehydrogenase
VTRAADAGSVAIGDLEVNRLGFGAMRITGQGIWGPPDDIEGSKAVLRRAVELGVDFIDTADSYGPEVSEALIAEALHPYSEGLVIATKGGLERTGPGQWPRNCRPEHLREACEGSLRRLRVERIDLYQLHAVDPKVPYQESVGALADLQSEGKIRNIGISNVGLGELETARSLVDVASVQNRFSIDDQDSADVLDTCNQEGLAFISWFPLAAGRVEEGDAVARIADAHDASPFQIAIAWLLARSPAMLPIPGTSSVEHLEQNVAADAIQLSAEELAELGA